VFGYMMRSCGDDSGQRRMIGMLSTMLRGVCTRYMVGIGLIRRGSMVRRR